MRWTNTRGIERLYTQGADRLIAGTDAKSEPALTGTIIDYTI
jgi:hypothetical protein